jgi:hypothetical protein
VHASWQLQLLAVQLPAPQKGLLAALGVHLGQKVGAHLGWAVISKVTGQVMHCGLWQGSRVQHTDGFHFGGQLKKCAVDSLA